MQRLDGRDERQGRPIEILTGVNMHAEGSALIKVGQTHVLCMASVEDRVPAFMRDTGQGWVTAEYGMLPRATNERTSRESTKGRPSGRTQEIQRLIGRSLRAVVDAKALGQRTVWIDCDVLQADGGTRCAAISGAYVALALALAKLRAKNLLGGPVLRGLVSATSVGIVGGLACLDLSYVEDSQADVDMNVVRTDAGRFVEVQGTAEKHPFSLEEMQRLLDLAVLGTDRMFEVQREVLHDVLPPLLPRT
ncbi:MAG TPA: ribonuclease PH [Candidatus Polarisedimenticolia bacterium]|nr:ribonuclease PH [Candidatus Polarisedimenticolia bacterium]